MTATLHDLLKSYREGGVFPSYDQLAAIAGQDQCSAAVRGEAVALREALDLAATWIENIKPEELELWRDVKATDIRRVLRAAPVSARAADAPSEPSGLTFDQWLDRKDENGWTEREAPCGEFRDMLRGWNAAMKFGKSRPADALDSQPTDFEDRPLKARVLRNELAIIIGCQDGRTGAEKADAVLNWIEKQGQHVFVSASSQPTKPDGWISIGDRLPDLHSTVALLDENRWMNTGSSDHNVNWHGAGYLCKFGQKYWSVFGESRSQCLDAVTHWMPIPLAPASSQPTDGGVRNG